MITIDVAVITYNQAPYVEQALQGISAQILDDNTKMRVIIADDCSTDGTLDRIKDCEKQLKQSYVYLESDHRLGMVGNYRRVIDAIQSPYCCILEGDDYWTDPHKLQKQVDYMRTHPDCGLCYTDCSIIKESSDNIAVRALFAETGHLLDEENPLYEGRYQANVTWMLNKNLFNYVSIPDDSMDIPLIFMYEARLNFKLGYVPGVTATYRLRRGSVSDCNSLNYLEFGGGYKWKKSVFKQCLRYALKFPEPEKTLKNIYSDGIYSMYLGAYLQDDKEIINLFESYLDDKITLSGINSLVDEILLLSAKYNQIRSSKAYRLGKLLLKPFQWMKKFKS